jgi:hypothetical protein
MKSFDIKKLLSHAHLHRRGEFPTIGEKARHDWKVILISFFLIVTALIITHSLLFVRVERGEFLNPSSEEVVTEDAVSREELEGAVQFFEEREMRLEALRVEKPVVVDPSW